MDIVSFQTNPKIRSDIVKYLDDLTKDDTRRQAIVILEQEMLDREVPAPGPINKKICMRFNPYLGNNNKAHFKP